MSEFLRERLQHARDYLLKSDWLSIIFLFIAAPTLIFLAILTPLGESPDEPNHTIRAASILRGQWIGHRVSVTNSQTNVTFNIAGVDIDAGYSGVFYSLPSLPLASHKPVSLDAVMGAFNTKWTGRLVFIDASNTAGYAPILYVPSALGMGLARLVRSGPMETVISGRLSNAGFYLLIGYIALRCNARIRPASFALLTLPMTLYLGATVNQDGPLIATSVLAGALLSERGALYWAGTIALACIVVAKPPYMPLALAALVPLNGEDWNKKRHISGFLLIIILGLAWAFTSWIIVNVPFNRPPYHPGPLWPDSPDVYFYSTDPVAQLRVLIAHPARFVNLPLNTLISIWKFLLVTAIGRLGPLDFNLPTWSYWMWYISLTCAFLVSTMHGNIKDGSRRIPKFANSLVPSIAIILGCLVSVYMIFILQYLTWTNVGHQIIDGIQGRYLLPVMPILILGLPVASVSSQSLRLLRSIFVSPAVASAITGLILLPICTVFRYYLR